jgi:hypothetical protein
MPKIQPKMYIFPIPNLKPHKLLSNISQPEKFPPTPGAVLRNTNTPKTSLLQKILLNPGHP